MTQSNQTTISTVQKITPFLWFNGNIEEAIQFYSSIFKNTKVLNTRQMVENGKIFTATIEIEGQQLMMLDGGPLFKFTEAFSLFVNCATQQEVDELWEKLSSGGEKSRCGWLKDKFGLSWQIIPTELGTYLSDSDPVKANRVMNAMLQMSKIETAKLIQAYEG
ncbi:MAG: VOC family protein [Ignavibacteriales bacterium]|nr:VOC family protein [Ignavibacteriales bacterium]